MIERENPVKNAFFIFYMGEVVLKTMGHILCVTVTFVIPAVNNRYNIKTKLRDAL